MKFSSSPSGRAFDQRDSTTGAPVAIVNQSFAREWFPSGAVGRRFALAEGRHREWRTIVGIVSDPGMGREATDSVREGVYLPLAQAPAAEVSFFARTAGTPGAITPHARRIVQAIDPDLPLVDIFTVQQTINAGAWPYRIFGSLLIAFGVAALFLATIGLYGVMTFSVARRTQEIGVRMAVGARRRDVLLMVLRQGLGQIGLGVLIGSCIAVALGAALRLLLFEVSPFDPLTFCGTLAVLALTGLAACLAPARRAARIDPMAALRYE